MADIASLGSILALGSATGNPKKKGKKKGGKKAAKVRYVYKKAGKKKGKKGRRNPSGFASARGIMGTAKGFAKDALIGGLAAVGTMVLLKKATELLQPRIGTNISTGVGGYAAQAAVSIGATMAARKFAGPRIGAVTGLVSAALLGKRIMDERVMPRIGGMGGGAPDSGGAAEVYETGPAMAGLGAAAAAPWARLPWGAN